MAGHGRVSSLSAHEARCIHSAKVEYLAPLLLVARSNDSQPVVLVPDVCGGETIRSLFLDFSPVEAM